MIKSLLKNKAIGWLLFFIILVSGFLISVFEDYNTGYVSLLFIIIGLVFLARKSFDSINIGLARTILGLLFIFSCFVKGVDPVGTQYRIEDYFIAFDAQWANPMALFLSIIMNE